MGRGRINTLRDLLDPQSGYDFAFHVWAFPENRIVYISNPKAACTTVKAHLRRLSELPDLTAERVHRLSAQRIDRIFEVSAEERIDLAQCVVFSSVREPIRRALSAFDDKFGKTSRTGKKFRRKLGVSGDAVIDWAFFLDHLKSTPLGDLDPHWRPQHLNLMHGRIHLDRVARVETLQSDLEDILSGHFPGKPIEALHENSTSRRNIARTKITLKDRLTLLRLYAADIHLYGYGNFWERLYTLPDYWAYRRKPLAYVSRPLNRRRLF